MKSTVTYDFMGGVGIGMSPRSLNMVVVVLAATALVRTAAAARSTGGVGPETTHHLVSRAVSAIAVDGVLEEPAWDGALQLELGYEVEPGENIEPPVRTICLVTYDDRNVYFAFRAFDHDPGRIRARLSDRDHAWHDDWVGIVLDTFNDQRRAYEMYSNPLGVQIDALLDEVGDNYDTSWNAIWHSAGRITEQGYEVEMAVPFHQIRFQSVDGDQVWGFDALRSYPRENRHKIGLFPRERGNNSYLSQTVKLRGMKGASPGRNLEVIPTLISNRSASRDSLPGGELESGGQDSDLGVSVRWGITPNLTLNGAWNPDFSQVEADAVQLDINEQFALYFQETRPFFMEGADYFSTRLGLVHTRTIADPSSAAKLTGKQGRHTYGVFSAVDEVTHAIFPGAEGSSGDSFDLETTGTVARYRYDFGSNSTVGAILTDRRGDGYSSRVVGADALYKIGEADQIRLEAASSRTVYNREMAESAEVPFGETLQDEAMVLDYLHTERGWWVNASHADVGEDFRADLGFRPQVDYRRTRIGGARVWWGEPGSGDWFHRMAWGAAVMRTERQNGDLLVEQLESWLNYRGPRDTFFHLDLVRGDRVHDGTAYALVFGEARFAMRPNRSLRFHIEVAGGDWIDYVNGGPADRLRLQPGVTINIGRHFLLNYDHTWSVLDAQGGRLFRAHVPELRIVQQFNNRMFVRAIVQYTDIHRNLSLYDEENRDDFEPESRDLFAQLLFSYKVNPQTALYVGYSDNWYGNREFGLTETGRTLFLKLGYAWVL